jgi:hypothetical protein
MSLTGRAVVVLLACGAAAGAEALPEGLPRLPYHLTARPWKPLGVERERYLDVVEGLCRFTVRHQDARGAVIDPYLKREHQYSTPYFAFAVGTLLEAGRGRDLLRQGVAAMDHATACFARGNPGIPDAHGEFFLASLPAALGLYAGAVPEETLGLWRRRLATPRRELVGGRPNNWRTYAMKGEWTRAGLGLVAKEDATAFIEQSWLGATQRDRICGDAWNLYQDRGPFPESHGVEAVGRGNLLALVEAGYDGPSHAELRRCVERGTAVALLLQDPSGQCPPNGRTDDHVFNDVLYQLAFDVMAERAHHAGDDAGAGAFRHAAMASFRSIDRWRRTDPPWDGSYFITKNRFDPAERVGYQPASQYGNYSGAVMIHLAEAYRARRTEVAERPSPVEIGGYALATDTQFSSALANAGGMQMFAALKGDDVVEFDHYWTALGVERFGRVGWDSRLGPSDGVRDRRSGRGASFAPTWKEEGRWVRLADVPGRYVGRFSVSFTHPLLVRCAIDYGPMKGTGPSFRHEFVVTPDGILATLRATGTGEFGVTWPLLVDDGRPLRARVDGAVAATSYADGGDEEVFLVPPGAPPAEADGEPLRSTYGWIRPVRAPAADGVNHTFIYPRGPRDPPADEVRSSFRLTDDGFVSRLGAVRGTLYTGRTSAGGEGSRVDCDGDGLADAVFSTPCGFVLQLQDGRVTAVETSRAVTAEIQGRTMALEPYRPVRLVP